MNPTPIKARLLPYKGLQDCLRITLEVPLEQAGSATAYLGWPSPSEEIWVAVVRLNNEVIEQNQEAADSELPRFLREKEPA